MSPRVHQPFIDDYAHFVERRIPGRELHDDLGKPLARSLVRLHRVRPGTPANSLQELIDQHMTDAIGPRTVITDHTLEHRNPRGHLLHQRT